MSGSTKAKRYRIQASRPRGDFETEETTIEGTYEDAVEALWTLVESLGIETAISEVEDSADPSPLKGHGPDCEITALLKASRRPVSELRFAHSSRGLRGARCTCWKANRAD